MPLVQDESFIPIKTTICSWRKWFRALISDNILLLTTFSRIVSQKLFSCDCNNVLGFTRRKLFTSDSSVRLITELEPNMARRLISPTAAYQTCFQFHSRMCLSSEREKFTWRENFKVANFWFESLFKLLEAWKVWFSLKLNFTLQNSPNAFNKHFQICWLLTLKETLSNPFYSWTVAFVESFQLGLMFWTRD